VRKAAENKTKKQSDKAAKVARTASPKSTETVAAEVKTEAVAEVKEEVKAEASPEAVAEVVAEAKAEETKAEVKVPAKRGRKPLDPEAKAAKEAAKKAAKAAGAKTTKATAAKESAPKKEAKTSEVVTLQVDGRDDLSMNTLIDRVKAAYVAEGHKAASIKNVQVYVKLSENMAYYVIDGYASGISLY
jgi:membrane protein involved in colicin uptake